MLPYLYRSHFRRESGPKYFNFVVFFLNLLTPRVFEEIGNLAIAMAKPSRCVANLRRPYRVRAIA
jgi:hypothetical protein